MSPRLNSNGDHIGLQCKENDKVEYSAYQYIVDYGSIFSSGR